MAQLQDLVQYESYVRNLVYELVRPFEVEDVTQDVLFEAVKSLPSFENRSNLRTWLHSLTNNVVKRHWVRELAAKRTAETFSLDEIYEYSDEPSERAWGWLKEFIGYDPWARKDDHFEVEHILNGLRKDYATILSDYYLEGLSSKEVATKHSITYSAFRSRMARALKCARKRFDDESFICSSSVVSSG